MPLHEFSADQLLTHLFERGEAYAKAKYEATLAESNHQRAKASVYQAIRQSGGVSVEDAKAQALNNTTVTETFIKSIEAELNRDRAYLALERGRASVDLWRTEQSNLRKL